MEGSDKYTLKKWKEPRVPRYLPKMLLSYMLGNIERLLCDQSRAAVSMYQIGCNKPTNFINTQHPWFQRNQALVRALSVPPAMAQSPAHCLAWCIPNIFHPLNEPMNCLLHVDLQEIVTKYWGCKKNVKRNEGYLWNLSKEMHKQNKKTQRTDSGGQRGGWAQLLKRGNI